MPAFEKMSRDELLLALRKLYASDAQASQAGELERVIQQLQVHQVELEMQNRELRESRQFLDESQQRYADLYDFAPVAYFTLDELGHILEANLAAAALLGMERERILGKRLGALVRMDEPRALRDHLASCLETRKAQTIEVSFTPRDRASMTVQLVSAPRLGGSGSANTCRCAMTDISALKRSEQGLRFLAAASETLTSELEPAEALQQVARLAVPLLGDLCIIDHVEPDRTLRRDALAFAVPALWTAGDHGPAGASPASVPSPQAQVVRSGAPLVLLDCEGAELSRALDAAGRAFVPHSPSYSLLCVPMNARGRTFATLTLGIASAGRSYARTDVELAQDLAGRAALAVENARLAASSLRALRMRQEVLELVSHDLGNWVQAVRLNLDILALPGGPEREAEARVAVERMREAVLGMNHLVNDLLDLRRVERGRLSMDPALVPALDLLQAARTVFEPQVLLRGISFALDAPLAPGLSVIADRRRVLQVLANLLGNAMKFTPRGGSITLSAEATGSLLWISVRDTGAGIPRDQLASVFERYWQATSDTQEGSGLGLYISRRIVEASAGTVRIESELGQGTAISFSLPLAEPLPAAGPAADGAILIVDDNASLRESIAAVLEASGYATAQAEHGQRALELAAAQRPALLLLDLNMPVMDGRATMEAIRHDPALSGLRVVLLTSDAGVDLTQAVRSMGADGFLRKPVGSAELLACIREVLAREPGRASPAGPPLPPP